MICIAAFIILALVSIPALVLHLIGKKSPRVERFIRPYFKMFQKAWYCVGRRATFRKCDSNFKDEIKNSVLSRLVVKHRKWVKPVSWAIEVAAVLVVLVTLWSLVTAVKSGLSLYVFGTCSVTKPEACALGEAEVCSTEDAMGQNFLVTYFDEWGDLFTGLPARIKKWDAREYLPESANFYPGAATDAPVALDVFDPGCINCLKSFNNQLQDGFFEQYNVALLPYPIKDSHSENGYRFPNSYLISSYIEAVRGYQTAETAAPEWRIVQKLFTEDAPDLSGEAVKTKYQNAFNGKDVLFGDGQGYSPEQAERVLQGWLREFGLTESQVAEIATRAHSDEVASKIHQNHELVDQKIRTKGIPTTIYAGKRHIGVWRK